MNKDLLKRDFTIKELAKEICYGKPLTVFIFLTVISLLLRIFYLALTGVRVPSQSSDYDSGFFMSGARLLLTSPGEYLSKFIKMPFYIGYTVVVAAIYAISGESNLLVCIVQVIFSSVCPYMLWKSCENFFGDRRVSLVCSLMMAVLPISFRWDSQITSDSFGMFSSILCIYAFSFYCKAENRRRETLLLLLSLLGFFLMRTTAGSVIAVILIYMIMELPMKKRAAIFGTLAAAAVLAVIFFLKGDGVHSLQGNLDYFARLYSSGEIIQRQYYYDMQGNIGDIFGIIFYRLLFYFTSLDIGVGVMGGHRLSFQLLHYLPLFPVFNFAFVGVIRKIAEKDRISIMFIWVIIVSALVQALTEIQFDLRYRDPVLPYFYMLAACEIIRFADTLKKKTTLPE